MQSHKFKVWMLVLLCIFATALKFVPPYSMVKYHALSCVYALASFCCIYFGCRHFGWSACKKQKIAIAIYVAMVFSALYLAIDAFEYIPRAINIMLVAPVFLAPLASVFIMPVLLGLSHKGMASQNNWLLYLLVFGPVFDFAAKGASV